MFLANELAGCQHTWNEFGWPNMILKSDQELLLLHAFAYVGTWSVLPQISQGGRLGVLTACSILHEICALIDVCAVL